MDQSGRVPTVAQFFGDRRSKDRVLRVSWHQPSGDAPAYALLSVWREARCTGTVRIDQADVPALLASLSAGLAQQADPSQPAT